MQPQVIEKDIFSGMADFTFKKPAIARARKWDAQQPKFKQPRKAKTPAKSGQQVLVGLLTDIRDSAVAAQVRAHDRLDKVTVVGDLDFIIELAEDAIREAKSA